MPQARRRQTRTMKGTRTAKTEVDELVRSIVSAYQPEKVILFGSYVYGEPDNDSDVDLLVVKRTDETPFQRRVTLRRVVSDPARSIPYHALVVTPEELSERLEYGDAFLREVVEEGDVVYAS